MIDLDARVLIQFPNVIASEFHLRSREDSFKMRRRNSSSKQSNTKQSREGYGSQGSEGYGGVWRSRAQYGRVAGGARAEQGKVAKAGQGSYGRKGLNRTGQNRRGHGSHDRAGQSIPAQTRVEQNKEKQHDLCKGLTD